jgi:hypothetical protein
LVIWCGATNAYGSNFLGINAGYNAINAYNSNFALVMLQQVQVVRISFGSAGQGATDANSSFFGNNAGAYATGAARSNSWFKLWLQRKISNFLGQSAGYKQALVTQILGSKCWFSSDKR